MSSANTLTRVVTGVAGLILAVVGVAAGAGVIVGVLLLAAAAFDIGRHFSHARNSARELSQ